MGAILADASEEDANNLYKFGEQIGLAFQLQDDFLDVYGDPKVFGKEIGGDITSNKKTYMLINAFNHANAQQREELNRWVSAKDFVRKEKVEAVTRLYDEIGIDKMAQEKLLITLSRVRNTWMQFRCLLSARKNCKSMLKDDEKKILESEV